jgi:hypothetical protein
MYIKIYFTLLLLDTLAGWNCSGVTLSLAATK